MKLSENRNSRSIYGNIVKTFIKLSLIILSVMIQQVKEWYHSETV
jgi:hypothetical protein